jgi:hypothetical protein
MDDPKPEVARSIADRALDLDILKQFLIHIQSRRFSEDFNLAGRKDLFHYTDLLGLGGIVKEHDLWLTNCRFSNDNREMLHGYGVAKAVIADQLAIAPRADADYLNQLNDLLDPSQPDDVYVCCFCEENNRLSQWRAYGVNGAGVSIEIEAKEFSWATGFDMPLGVMRLWKVYYDEHEQRKLVAEAIDFGRLGKDPSDNARRAAHAIRFFIPTFKDEDFHEEGEWRLIFTPGSQCPISPRFRVARQMLVPFFSFRELVETAAAGSGHLTKLPIRRVMIGPNPSGSLNKESVKMLLVSCQYEDATVEVSKTPYRP